MAAKIVQDHNTTEREQEDAFKIQLGEENTIFIICIINSSA